MMALIMHKVVFNKEEQVGPERHTEYVFSNRNTTRELDATVKTWAARDTMVVKREG